MKKKFGPNFDMQKFMQMQKAQSDTSSSDVSMVQLTSNSKMEDCTHSQKTLVTMEDHHKPKTPAKEAPNQKKSERRRRGELPPSHADGGFLPPIAGLPPIGRQRVGQF